MWRSYLIHAKAVGAENARLNLARQVCKTYLPWLIRAWRRLQWHGRRRHISPTFSPHVPCHLREGCRSRERVHSILSVTSVVQSGLQYALIVRTTLSPLYGCREHFASVLHRMRKRRPFIADTLVNVVHRPFEGLERVFEGKKSFERSLFF